jgi:hypothetical protein
MALKMIVIEETPLTLSEKELEKYDKQLQSFIAGEGPDPMLPRKIFDQVRKYQARQRMRKTGLM